MSEIQFLEIRLSSGGTITLNQSQSNTLTVRESNILLQIVRRLNKQMNRVKITEPKPM